MAEVTHTNLEHKHVKSCYSASVKRKTLPPFRGGGVRVSLVFCLATKQNLKWPTFIPTPIPPPLASSSSHTHSTANTRGLNEDWKCEVERPITRHETPCWYQLPFQVQKEAFSETIPNPEAIQVFEKYLRKKKVKTHHVPWGYEFRIQTSCSGWECAVVNHCPTGYQQPPPSQTQFNYGQCGKNRVRGNLYKSNSNCVWNPFCRKSLS